MNWTTIGIATLTFAAGIVTKVLADWWTDTRRSAKQRSTTDQHFARIEAAMPALLNELQADILTDSIVREFVTLPSKHNHFNHGETTRFEYYGEDHPGLAGMISMLENSGHIWEVTVGNHPIYRMSEEFVQWLERR